MTSITAAQTLQRAKVALIWPAGLREILIRSHEFERALLEDVLVCPSRAAQRSPILSLLDDYVNLLGAFVRIAA